MAFTAKSMLPARRGPVAWIISSVDGHIYTDILAAPRQHPSAVRFAVTYRGRSLRQNPRWRSPPCRLPESFRIVRRAKPGRCPLLARFTTGIASWPVMASPNSATADHIQRGRARMHVGWSQRRSCDMVNAADVESDWAGQVEPGNARFCWPVKCASMPVLTSPPLFQFWTF